MPAEYEVTVLKILRESGGFVSGGLISGQLGLTRAAVWKKIAHLRENGFIIEAAAGRGYRLVETPDLSPEELKSLLGPHWELVYMNETGSTNDDAMALAVKGSALPNQLGKTPHNTLVVADCQRKGKGRLGRKWASPAGKNIHMSAAFRPSLSPKDATLLTILSAVASVNALKKLTGLDARIKWPNDIVAPDKKNKKLGGILLEMRSEPDRISLAVVGIGINVNSRLKDLPADIRSIATTILEETGRKHKRTPIIAEIVKEMENGLKTLEKEGRGRLLDDWRGLSSTLGREVLVVASNETLRGWAEDIDNAGRLLLRLNDGSLSTISSGDLTQLR